jgi:hypothetical protein
MENNFNLKKFLAEGKMLKEDVNKIKTTDELEAYINSLVDDYVQDTIDVAGYDLDWDGNGSNMGISKEELINDFSDYIKGEIKYISEGEMLKEDEDNNVDYTTDWSKMELLRTEEGPEGTWCLFLDPEDETAEEDGFSFAVRKSYIEDVASGENNYVLDGDNQSTNMSQEEAQSILNKI